MGSLVRRYWIPALLSEEIPKPDCSPVRVRILGEELVAFRDSQSRIGLPRKQIGPDFRKVRNPGNHYLQDREVQRSRDFTGIEDFLNEDACATESMGPICDRTPEHLRVSDQGVKELRRFLFDALARVQAGQNPPHVVSNPERNNFRDIDAVWKVLPPGEKWRDHLPHLT